MFIGLRGFSVRHSPGVNAKLFMKFSIKDWMAIYNGDVGVRGLWQTRSVGIHEILYENRTSRALGVRAIERRRRAGAGTVETNVVDNPQATRMF